MAFRNSVNIFLFLFFTSASFLSALSPFERFFYGRAGICFTSISRRLCIPVVLSEDYLMPRKHKRMKVRVLLAQKDLKDGFLWTLSGQSLKIDRVGGGNKQAIFRANEAKVSVRYGQLHVNNRRVGAERFDVSTLDSEIKFDKSRYGGTFSILLHDNKVDLINSIDIEEYVYSVLRSESWPGWPLEVNKVQAIATRTYVVSKVLEGKRARYKVPYHIKNTNIHQTYQGLHEFYALKKATEETEGVIMSHNREPIVAMFDACCGGIVPGNIEGIDFQKLPYLKRDYACTHCASSSLYSFQADYSIKRLQKLLKEQGIEIGHLHDMKVVQKDPAGIVTSVVVSGSAGQATLSKNKVYALCKKITGFAYDIKKNGSKFIFEGFGYGHHLGLCQWGARSMVRQGWRYRDILRFYYPDVQFMKLVYGW